MHQSILQTAYAHPSLRSADYARIEAAHQRVEFRKGEVLSTAGHVADTYYVVESGLLRKYVYNSEGGEITTRFCSEAQFAIVIPSFFQRLPSLEYIAAVTDGAGWRIEYAAFQDLFGSLVGLRRWGRTWMAGQLFLSEQYALNLLTKSATDRYVELVSERPEIIRQASLKHIASYLGVTDTSLSRIRKSVAGK